MKHKGNISDFREERDIDLHRSFMDVLRTATETPLSAMFALAASRPSKRFWVSEGRAAIVLGAMRRGESLPHSMLPKRRAMFEELFRRVSERMEREPGLCLTHAVNEVVYEEAPEFYLAPEAARSIIYRLRQRRRLMDNG